MLKFKVDDEEIYLLLPTPKENVENSNVYFDWTQYLEVKESTVPNAGKGVFAKTDLPDDLAIPYFGELLSSEKKAVNKGSHVGTNTACPHQYVVDAHPSLDKRGAFITGMVNEPGEGMNPPNMMMVGVKEWDIDKPSKQLPSLWCRAWRNFEQNNKLESGGIYFFTLRDIKKGEELLTFYNEEYQRNYPLWDSLSNIKSRREKAIAAAMEAERQRMEAERQRMEAERQRMEAERQRMEAERQRMERNKTSREGTAASPDVIEKKRKKKPVKRIK